MEKDEFTKRVEDYRSGQSKDKPTKDEEGKKHACLVEWDEFDEISRIENSIMNTSENYKDYDRENVDVVMKLIQDKEQKMLILCMFV